MRRNLYSPLLLCQHVEEKGVQGGEEVIVWPRALSWTSSVDMREDGGLVSTPPSPSSPPWVDERDQTKQREADLWSIALWRMKIGIMGWSDQKLPPLLSGEEGIEGGL